MPDRQIWRMARGRATQPAIYGEQIRVPGVVAVAGEPPHPGSVSPMQKTVPDFWTVMVVVGATVVVATADAVVGRRTRA